MIRHQAIGGDPYPGLGMGLGQNLLKGDVVRRLLKQREPPDPTVQDMIRKLSSCKAGAAGHTALVSIPETRVMKRLPTPFLRHNVGVQPTPKAVGWNDLLCRLYFNECTTRMRNRHGLAAALEVLNVKLNCLLNELQDLFSRFPRSDASRQVRHVGAEACWAFLHYYHVPHWASYFRKPACLLEHAVQRTRRNANARLTGNSHGAQFTGMMELPVAASLPDLEPAVGLDQRDQLFDFHALVIAQLRTDGITDWCSPAPRAVTTTGARAPAGPRERAEGRLVQHLLAGSARCCIPECKRCQDADNSQPKRGVLHVGPCLAREQLEAKRTHLSGPELLER